MASCPPSNQVYDSIRKKWIEATPEEIVRQKILSHLVTHLGYPPHAIAIEKKLSELPNLKTIEVPNRRLDILCFESETLRPLLLIECKGVPLNKKMLAQLMGYNAFIGAPLICLANDKEFLLQWEDGDCKGKTDQLPTYEALKHG